MMVDENVHCFLLIWRYSEFNIIIIIIIHKYFDIRIYGIIAFLYSFPWSTINKFNLI